MSAGVVTPPVEKRTGFRPRGRAGDPRKVPYPSRAVENPRPRVRSGDPHWPLEAHGRTAGKHLFPPAGAPPVNPPHATPVTRRNPGRGLHQGLRGAKGAPRPREQK